MKSTQELLDESGIFNGQTPSHDNVDEYFTRENFVAMFGECNWTDDEMERAATAAHDRLVSDAE